MTEETINKLASLLQGKIPEKFGADTVHDEKERALAEISNQLIDAMQQVHEFIVPLSKGELHDLKIPTRNFLASPFKELHSRLLHLTWQAEQVASGHYEQRIDFMGDFSKAFNSMVIALDRNEKLLKNKIDELEKTISQVRKLEGILPICSNCKKIRLEGMDPKKQDNWIQIEVYVSKRTDAQFSHSMCPECLKEFYPDFAR